MCAWSGPYEDKAITNQNVATISETTEENCKIACEATSTCKSIDWKPLEGRCSLNGVTKDEVALDQWPTFVYFEKTCHGRCLTFCVTPYTIHYLSLHMHSQLNVNKLLVPIIAKENPCDHDPCKNEGQCIEEQNGHYSCLCEKGYSGEHCEGKQYSIFTPCSSATQVVPQNFLITIIPLTQCI